MPLKCPTIFNTADIPVITKMDLAAATKFDLTAAQRDIHAVPTGMHVLEVWANNGAGSRCLAATLAMRHGQLTISTSA